MEGPLLSKSEHIVDTTADVEHIVHITADVAPPPTRERIGKYSALVEAVLAYDGSLREPNCCFAIEFVLTLVQIVVAIVIMIKLLEEEDPETTLIYNMITYTLGCIVNLPVLCFRSCSMISVSDPVYKCQKMVEIFFIGWSFIVFWYFVLNSSFLNDTTQHFWLSLAFFAFIIIRYGIPNWRPLMYCFPCYIIGLIGDVVADLNSSQMVVGNIIFVIILVIIGIFCSDR